MSKYHYGASGRYSWTLFGGETSEILQVHTRAYRKVESRFLTAQEALDLLRFLQAHESELVALAEDREVVA